MDENQNYGYSGSVNDQQGAYDVQQPYGIQQPYGEQQSYSAQQPYGEQQPYSTQQSYGEQQPYSAQQPYGEQQVYENQQPYGNQQYTQNPYGVPQQQPMGPQYTQTPYGVQQQYNQQYYGQPVKAVVYDAVPDQMHGTSVAALVCGILGLLFFWIPGLDLILCLAGLICGIIAVAKGFGGRGMAITGLVLSIIDCILTLIFFYFFALGLMLA